MTTTLSERLAALGLHATASQFDDLVAMATRSRWRPLELLEYLVDQELKERSRRSLE